MARSAIELEGVREVRAALRKISEGAADLKAAHLEAAEIVATEARNLVPVLSGRLSASIRAAGQARGGVVRAGYGSVPYAGVQHFGWARHHIEPQPFLYDAVDARVNEVKEAYLTQLQQIIAENGLAE